MNQKALALGLTLGVAVLSLSLCGGCSLYFANEDGQGSGSGSDDGSGSAAGSGSADFATLTFDRSIAAEGQIFGVDPDGDGNLWIVYSRTTGGFYVNKLVTLVHWNPQTSQRLATYEYDDEYTPVRGLAYVQGRVWLNYHPAGEGTPMIRVIDPGTGAIERTLGSVDGTIEMSPLGADRALLSNLYNEVISVDVATGGYAQTFSTSVFTTTQTGIAWRPGEIWVASWYSRLVQVYDELGVLKGVVDLSAIPSTTAADDQPILSFDRGQLLVGYGSQLTWFTVH